MSDYVLSVSSIDAYIEFLRLEERSAATIEKYSRDVTSFYVWLCGRLVNHEIVSQWKAQLLVDNLSPATVNAKISAVNGLFKYLGWNDCCVRFLKVQKRAFRDASRDLTRDEYMRLVSAANSSGKDWLGLLLETICATGIRVSEVKYITVSAVCSGRVDISLKGKIRRILLPGKLCRKLLKYARKQNIVSGEIFLSRNNTGLSRIQIWRAMKRLCKTAGVEESKVFPHNLRHLFAITFYRTTHDVAKLADVLGHSSINTTRIYLMSTDAEHVRCLERLGLVS